MPLTQIPSLQDPPPAPGPSGSDPNQLELELYKPDEWETAYREMHDFPTLLIQAQDDLARSRKREAFWMSLFAHAILLLLILHPPDFAKYWFKRSVMLIKPVQNRELTFVEAPPDNLKVKRPDTNKISDKDRIASTKQPQLNREELKKLLDASRAGRPNPPAAKPEPQQQAQQAMAQPAQPQPQQQPPPPANQEARLQPPAVNPRSLFKTGPMSASRIIQQAENAAAAHREYGGDDGDLGLGQRQRTTRMGPEILSDTMGVDFGPYLAIVVQEVKRNWYNLMPESASLGKRGVVSLQFSILKNGEVAGLQYVSGSGDVSLDRAAYGGITSSVPFPPLPSEFTGPNLTLRFTFFYNLNTDGTPLQ
ncbi:MAG TPA: TonB family protein [Terriglobales bacterium]|nr:TonB family protein [Terriglobales bacterium]